MAMRPYRRRRILIDRFQYRLLVINLLYFCTILLIFATALFLPLILELHSDSILKQAEAASEFLSLHARVWPALFLVFVLLAFHSIFVSHRIVGPLYRFRTTFQAVAGGDLSVRATLRKHDYLEKESESVNQMIASLQAKVQDIEGPSQEVQARVLALERAIECGAVADMHQSIKELRVHVERLQGAINQFRLAPQEPHEEDDIAIPVASTSTPEDSGPAEDGTGHEPVGHRTDQHTSIKQP